MGELMKLRSKRTDGGTKNSMNTFWAPGRGLAVLRLMSECVCILLQGILNLIENADATPPHPDVVVRLGSPGDMLGIVKFTCHGALSWMYAY